MAGLEERIVPDNWSAARTKLELISFLDNIDMMKQEINFC